MAKFGGSYAEQPFVVQLAAVLFEDTRPVAHLSVITVPEDRGNIVSIPADVVAIHGISDDLVASVGVPYKVAVGMFNNLLRRADRQVAHNIQFDDLMMHATYMRIAADQDVLNAVPKFCTMKTATPVCGLRNARGGPKWPKLIEAHKHFLGEGFEGEHDAMNDVMACARVMFALEDQGYALC
jgi:DNA polymerase III subunit epsilon